MMYGDALRFTSATGRMRGIIGSSLLWYICILQSMLQNCRKRMQTLLSNLKSPSSYIISDANWHFYHTRTETKVAEDRVWRNRLQLIFTNSILPALAFSLDMFAKTAMSFGVNEVLLASVLGSVVFSFLAAQPLVIVGVTGMNGRS